MSCTHTNTSKFQHRNLSQRLEIPSVKLLIIVPAYRGIPRCTMMRNPPSDAGDARDMGLIPRVKKKSVPGRSTGVGNVYPLQYSCLEKSTDRGAWRATVHGAAGSNMTEHTHIHTQMDLKGGIIST